MLFQSDKTDGRGMMGYKVLIVESGLFQGSRYVIFAPFRIGRHPENDLQITDPNVSRFHALVEPKGQGLLLRDLGSKNGTFVNGERIREAWLRAGDEVRVGKVRMRLVEEGPSEEERKKKESIMVLTSDPRGRVKAHTIVTGQFSVSTDGLSPEVADQLNRLQAVFQANLMLSAQADLDGVLRTGLEDLMEILRADRGYVLTLDEGTRDLRVRYSLSKPGFDTEGDILVSSRFLDQALREKKGLVIEDTGEEPLLDVPGDHRGPRARCALCVPLVDRDQTLGLLYFDNLVEPGAFSEEDLQLVTAIAAPMAVQMRNIQFRDQLQRAYLDTLSVLANAIEARDHYTVGHTWRVTRFALAMVDRMGCTEEQRRYTQMGGILHDIGKIAVEDSILRKKGPLTKEEYQKMQLHPEHGARILKDVEFLKPVIPYVLFHQERWDGKGYPFGLKKDEVPWEGRLLGVCDAFDAMTSHRPYRRTMSPEEAWEEILKERGKQFDPEMVDLFKEIWETGQVANILQHYAKSELSIACPFCSTHIPLGEKPAEGTFVECPVCGKSSVVMREGRGWKGELAW